jgi:DNA helicase-2/ATP-dependent DNA helicase PcrA
LRKHNEIEGNISLEKMVVIARNRFVFRALESSLKNSELPFSLRKGERQLEPSTELGKILDYSIRLKLNPRDWVDGKKLCQILRVVEPESWSLGVLNELTTQVRNLGGENSDLYVKLMTAINSIDIENPKIPKLIKDFKEILEEIASGDLSDDKAEGIKLSIEELNEFNRAWTTFRRKGLGESLAAFRNALALGQLSENNVEDGLTLSTVHTMKGLEKDIVFLVGMCEGVFPDYRAKSDKELEEERNNAFVAVTRAKRWLYMTYPKQRMMPWGDRKFQMKSRFIQ